MPRGRFFQRPRNPRAVGKQIIIVCEGEKTERGYFEEIRKSLRLPTVRVRVIHADATDPRSIVRAAVDYRQERKRDKAWAAGDRAWAVFDGDEHRLGNPANWNDALQTAASKDIKLAVSNPSFELWYLLHYREHVGQLTRQDALRLLREHVENYQKTDKLWPVPLQPLTADATRHAKRIAARAAADELQPHTNPCTGVCDLVESLLALAEELRH